MWIIRGIGYVVGSTAVLLGCSSLPSAPSAVGEIVVSAAEPAYPCASLPDTVSVQLSISNQGRGTFRTYIDTMPGPPYELSWLSYYVLNETANGRSVEWEHGAGGHGPLPQNTLAIGPNDSTKVFAKIYSTAEMDKAATYRIQVEAQDDQKYLSDPFTICQP